GNERGAFSGAREARPGLFQRANRGTLFLDEIGLMPLSFQTKLLNAIERGCVRRIGSTRDEGADGWVITASNEDGERAGRGGRLGEALYPRLAVVALQPPPLRERGDDILLLAEFFLASACREYGLRPKSLSTDARSALLDYEWPGNVRELKNLIERAVL